MLWHAVQPFLRAAIRVRVVVAAAAAATAAESLGDVAAQVEVLAVGGATRASSVRGGLQGLADDDWALVHDAARPCLADESLARLLADAAADAVGGLLVLPVVDSLKYGDAMRVRGTLSRADFFFGADAADVSRRPVACGIDGQRRRRGAGDGARRVCAATGAGARRQY